MGGSPFDASWFRQVLGQYPTGVCVVTAVTASGERGGMVVGSFTSVSLDPPMVAFFPSNSSQTWPELSGAASFCVNVLAADQEPVARRFASAPMGTRFDGVGARSSPAGAPLLDGVVAWIDCTPALVREAGDHFLVLGDVTALGIESSKLPLLFFRGGYGSFTPLVFTASDSDGVLTRQLRQLDLVRPVLRRIPESGLRCLVSIWNVDRVAVIGRFEPPAPEGTPEPTMLVGLESSSQPHGPSIFHAWADPADVDAWVARCPAEDRDAEWSRLAAIRSRGYSIGVVDTARPRFAHSREEPVVHPSTLPGEVVGPVAAMEYDPPEVTEETLRWTRLVTVPVFDADGQVVLAITVYGFRREPDAVQEVQRMLQAYGEEATRLVRGQSLART